MRKDLKGQILFERCVITLASLATGFCVFMLTSMHAARYGGAKPNDSIGAHSVSRIMEVVGFSSESVNAVSAAGLREFTFAIIACLLLLSAASCYCNNKIPSVFKRKYVLLLTGAIIALAAIALQLNGTSLHCWAELFQTNETESILWGITRAVRSDEYAVWTPMAISQKKTGFPAVSNVIGGGGTDVTWISMGGVPAFNKALVFKPLYWGLILFGNSYGLSILWIGRTFLLFFATYYCALIYTEGKRQFSFAAACMITLSPYIQWWFSQSVAEIIIFPELIFLCYWKYLQCQEKKGRISLAVLAAWLFGCLVMVGYPKWIIPAVYLLTSCLIYTFVKKRRSLSVPDTFIIAVPALAALTWLGLIAHDTWPSLMAVRNSVYPGESLYVGGSFPLNMALGLQAAVLPYVDAWTANQCEMASFVSLAPVGAVLTLYSAKRNRKIDGFDIILLVFELLILLICVLGIPAEIARITLISMCGRLEMLFGIVDVMLLIRAISKQVSLTNRSGAAAALILSVVSVLFLRNMVPEMNVEMLLLITAAYFMLCLILLIRPFQSDRNRYDRFISCCIVMLMIIAGAFINPVQKGAYAAYRTNLLETVQSVEDEEGDLYFCEGGFPVGNYLLMAGKRVFNSTQVYADTDRWRILDPDGTNVPVYNRLCNISAEITEGETELRLLGADHVYVGMSFEDLLKTGVKYVVSQKGYTAHNGVVFERVGEGEGWKIYRILKEP